MSARANVVLPAPRSPESVTRSPGMSALAMSIMSRMVACSSGSTAEKLAAPGTVRGIAMALPSGPAWGAAHAAVRSPAWPSGKTQVTVVPRPTAESSVTVPPCSSTKERTSERPRPVPR